MLPLLKPPATNIEHASSLINTENWRWNEQLVRQTLIAPDVATILNIPLRQGDGEDFYAWAFDASGNYIVKTSYHTLVTQKERLALEEGRLPVLQGMINRCGRLFGSSTWCQRYGCSGGEL